MKAIENLHLSAYVQERDYVIDEILNNVQNEWRGDNEMISGAINLTVQLKVAEPSPEFVKGLHGFMLWAQQNKKPRGSVLATIFHDLREFAEHRNEKWFSPRTESYQEFAP